MISSGQLKYLNGKYSNLLECSPKLNTFLKGENEVETLAFSNSILEIINELESFYSEKEQGNPDNFYEIANDFLQILLEKKYDTEIVGTIIYDKIPMFYHKCGNYDKAISILENYIDKYNFLFQENPYLRINTYSNLLDNYLFKGEEELHIKAVKNLKDQLNNIPNGLAFYYCRLSVCYIFNNNEKVLGYLLKAKENLELKERVDYLILSQINKAFSITLYHLESYFLSESYAISEVYACLKGGLDVAGHIYDSIASGGLISSQKELYYFNKALSEIEKQEGVLSPNLVMTYLNIAVTYLNDQQYENALAFTEKGLGNIRINNQDKYEVLPNLRYIRASVFNETNQHKKAIDELGSITIDGSVTSTRFKIDLNALSAYSHALNQDFSKAFDILNEAIRLEFEDYEVFDPIFSNPPIHKRNQAAYLEDLMGIKIDILHLKYLKEPNNLALVCASIFTIQIHLLMTNVILSHLKTSESKQRQNKLFGPKYKAFFSILIDYFDIILANQVTFQEEMLKVQEANRTYYPIDQFNFLNSLEGVQQLLIELIERDKSSTLKQFVIQQKEVNLPINIQAKESSFYFRCNHLFKEIQLQESLFFNTNFSSNEEEEKALFDLFETRYNFVNEWEKHELFKLKNKKHYPTQELESDFKRIIYNYRKIQYKLSIQQAVLNYFIADNHLFINFISSNEFSIEKVKLPDNFNEIIRKFKLAINLVKSSDYIKVSNLLYELLIEPIQNHLERNFIDHLFIIPHKELSSLPFECVFYKKHEKVSGQHFKNFPFLIERFTIGYHYSLSLFYESLQTLDRKTELTSSAYSYVGYAPVYKNDKHSAVENSMAPETTRSVRIGDQDYKELLHSEIEIESVKKLFKQQNSSAEIYLHQNATIKEFTKSTQSKDIIHIAAHGYELGNGIELSGIVFSPKEGDENGEEAIFYLQDAYNLKIEADLVVLSSCKSGIGKYLEGEGVMAMNRGFIQAGAKNVLYTLFKVYDKASSEFIQYFFKLVLEQKLSYSKALQLSKLHFIQSGKYSPKHWAGFVLIGN